jgi:regulator of replication initiation timing
MELEGLVGMAKHWIRILKKRQSVIRALRRMCSHLFNENVRLEAQNSKLKRRAETSEQALRDFKRVMALQEEFEDG